MLACIHRQAKLSSDGSFERANIIKLFIWIRKRRQIKTWHCYSHLLSKTPFSTCNFRRLSEAEKNPQNRSGFLSSSLNSELSSIFWKKKKRNRTQFSGMEGKERRCNQVRVASCSGGTQENPQTGPGSSCRLLRSGCSSACVLK